MQKFQEEFSVFKNANGEYFGAQDKDATLTEVKLAVQRPTHLQRLDADFQYNKEMNKLIDAKIMPRAKFERVIRENGIWDDSKDAQEKNLAKSIVEARDKLKKGKIKLSEAVKIAKQSIKDNYDYLKLTMERNEILNTCAESIAENHKFNYLVSVCTVYNDNVKKPFFRDYEDYLIQDNRGNIVTYLAGLRFSKLNNNLSEDFRADWPEFKFLKKYGFVNDKLEFVNKEGKLVDETGTELPEVQEMQVETDVEAEFLPDDVDVEVPVETVSV